MLSVQETKELQLAARAREIYRADQALQRITSEEAFVKEHLREAREAAAAADSSARRATPPATQDLRAKMIAELASEWDQHPEIQKGTRSRETYIDGTLLSRGFQPMTSDEAADPHITASRPVPAAPKPAAADPVFGAAHHDRPEYVLVTHVDRRQSVPCRI